MFQRRTVCLQGPATRTNAVPSPGGHRPSPPMRLGERQGAKREPVLAAWGHTAEGRRVLLHLMAGSKEDAETVTAIFEDLKMRGLNDPLLVTSDGAPGILKAIEVCFPRAA